MYGELPILRNDPTDTELTTRKITAITVLCVLNVFMFLGNSISILTICGKRTLRRNVSYWFVLNLAVIDLLISVTVLPLNTVWEYYGTFPFGSAACYFITFVDICFNTLSAYAIVLVSIDKYLYITYAIHYYDRMTKRVAVVLITLVWTLVITFALVSVVTKFGEGTIDDMQAGNATNTCVFIMTKAYIVPSAFISFFTPFGILCFTSARIVCIATKHIKLIHSTAKPSQSYTDSEVSAKNKSVTRYGPTLCVTRVDFPVASIELDSPVPHRSKSTNSLPIQEVCDSENHEEYVADTINTVNKTHLKEKRRKSGNMSLKKSQNNISQICDRPRRNSVPCIIIHSDDDEENNVGSVTELQLQNATILCERHRTTSLTWSDNFQNIVRKQKPYFKLFGTVTIVIVCFMVMCAPYFIASMVDVWCHCVDPWLYEDVLAVLYYMHSLVNPYIYISTDRKYRAALKLLWRRKCYSKKYNNGS